MTMQDENATLEQSSPGGSLELAGRTRTNHAFSMGESAVFGISINDEENIEILHDDFESQHRCSQWIRNVHIGSDVVLLVISFSILVISASLIEAYKTRHMASNARMFLLIARAVGVLTFFSQLAMFLAVKISFSQAGTCFSKRSASVEKRKIANFLKRFILAVIFEETAVRDYLSRVSDVEDHNQSNKLLDFMESAEMSEFVSGKLGQLYSSPEGAVLDILGADKSKLESFCKSFLSEVICSLHAAVFKNVVSCECGRPEFIRRHVEAIVNEYLHGMDLRNINKFLKTICNRRLEKMSSLVFVFMAGTGCILQLIHTYALS